MRTNTFYVITDSHNETVGYCPVFYSKNEYLVKEFIAQNKDAEYEVFEFQGDNIIELEDDIRYRIGCTLEPQADALTTLTSVNGLISVITSSNYYCDTNYCELIPQLINAIVSAWHNIMLLKKYVNPEYADTMDIFMKVIYKYICRLIIFDNYGICDVDSSIKNPLGLKDDDSVDDVVDDVMLFYMYEYGMG